MFAWCLLIFVLWDVVGFDSFVLCLFGGVWLDCVGVAFWFINFFCCVGFGDLVL
jgi:hypothetical protein